MSEMPEAAIPDGRLTRILAIPAIQFILGLGAILVTVSLVQATGNLLPGRDSQIGRLLVSLVLSVAVVAAYRTHVRFVEKRTATELGARNAVRHVALGLLIGFCLFAATIGSMALLGVYQVRGHGAWQPLVPALALALLTGIFEEILLRGLVFRFLERWLGSWSALILSALLFGALHLANPHASPVAALAIALEAGVMLAAAYMLTRSLWLAIGIHAGWNFTQGAIFSVAVSGNESHGFFIARMQGPDYLTGGKFGAEASLIAVFVCMAIVPWMLRRVIKQGGLVLPAWKRQ